MITVDTLFTDVRIATMNGPGLGIIERGMLATRAGRIVYVGEAAEAPAFQPVQSIGCDGRWMTPGLIDCHTHLVYAGDRAAEFEMRLAGASYEEIARAGGGILSTVRATRSADRAQLVRESLPRLDALIAEGVTTVEIKSGYGLTPEAELRQLQAAGDLGDLRNVGISRTLLAAHALPPEFAARRAEYIAQICNMIIPAAVSGGLADAVDAFCEGIAFSPEETAAVFEAAKAHGLAVKLHADQLSDTGGAALAARFGALSADHLEWASPEGIAAMATAGTVAVMLPAAYYVLRDTHLPPIETFRAAGVRLALATDCNPGTAPLTSPLLAMNMAATLFRMRVDECLLGMTREAAAALGRHDIGVLAAGNFADLCLWSVERLAELVYRLGFNPLFQRYRGA
ncbi:HutI Imidazolonepropionase and related amidohydrolases [Rhabdaerophilaceae bacterium]